MNRKKGEKAIKITLSVFLAAMLWLYVGSVDSAEITVRAKDVPVYFVGEDDVLADRGLMLVNASTDTVDLKLRARRSVLYALDTRDLSVEVNLKDINNTGSFALSYSVNYPANVQKNKITVDSASCYSVSVIIGELFKKTVDVKYEVTGEVKAGYTLREPIISVDSLNIHGEQKDVIRVSHAKVIYDVEGLDASVNEMVSYQFYDSADRPIEDVKIYANHDELPLSIPIYQVKQVTLKVNLVEAPGLRTEDVVATVLPQTLTIAGERYLMQDISELLVAEYNLGEILNSSNRTVTLRLPDGVISLDGKKDVTVSITLKNGIESARFETSNLLTKNVPEGMVATITTERMNVMLRGKAEAVENCDVEKIVVVADLAGINGAGHYSVPAIVRYEGEEDLGALGSYQVEVDITEELSEVPENSEENTETENG